MKADQWSEVLGGALILIMCYGLYYIGDMMGIM